MNFKESFQNALRAIHSNKLRTFLTMLGIIIGIFAVILLMSVGEGSKRDILKQIQATGSDNLILSPGASTRIFGGGPLRPAGTQSGIKHISYEDIKAIETKTTYPILVSPQNSTMVSVKMQDTVITAQALFINENYFSVNNTTVVEGRPLNNSDLRNRTRSVVIGPKVKEELFNNKDPIGQIIRIDKTGFKVVGVTEEKGQIMGVDQDNIVLIPLTVGEKLFNISLDNIRVTYIKSIDPKAIENVASEIEKILTRRHKTKDFTITSQKALFELFSSVTNIFTAVLAAIGSLSLLVGGIGIMNIMLVSVTERTREIGIRKAVGARERDILIQFLIESSVLTISGGMIGMILGIITSKLVPQNIVPTYITTFSVIIAVVFSISIGIFFGVYPARKAARLDPVQALRYE